MDTQSKALKAAAQKLLNETNEQGVTTAERIVRSLIEKAMEGDVKAMEIVFEIIEPNEPTSGER